MSTRHPDYGKTWTSLSTPDLNGYAHVVREDLVNPNLLFVGTEFGLFISIDGGAHWAQFKGDLPNVAVRDIAIQPRESDLILATHGRGIYILDDLTPLRALTSEMLTKDLVMLPSRPSVLELPAGEQRFDGDSELSAAPWKRPRPSFITRGNATSSAISNSTSTTIKACC